MSPVRIPVLLLSILLVLPLRADADGYEETEYRLKTAGIDEELREEIHTAIRKGVAHLRRQQWKRGNFPGTAGQTVLAGLALRHAALPDAVEGADRAIRWALKYASKEIRKKTYEGGILAMLLHAAKAHPKYLRSIHENLSKGPQSNHGYWGYGTGGRQGPANLSTAQFGCLGLWTGERAGAPVASKAWRLHLEALLRGQAENGSWSYYAPGDPSHGTMVRTPQAYPTGTYMGLADLLLARQALLEELTAEPERLAQVDIAVACAHAALRRHAQWTLGGPRMPGALGTFIFYRLYALEKVCIFADLEDVGGVAWYREGARWLLDSQLKDGGWAGLARPGARGTAVRGQGNVQSTSFALLFLLRASAVYHPVTPRPVDTPGTAITPRAKDESVPAAGPGVPVLEGSQRAVRLLEDALKKKRLQERAPYQEALRRVEETYLASYEDGVFATRGHDLWARRAEAVLLALAVRFHRAKAADRLLWQAIALDALEVLAVVHPRAGRPLMEHILALEPDKGFRKAYQTGWYGTAIETLRQLQTPGFEAWLGVRCLSPEPGQWTRTAAVLTAMGGMAPTLKGSKRHQAARAIFARMHPVLRRSLGNPEVRHLTRDIQIALYRLARGSNPDSFPGLDAAITTATASALTVWWKRHRGADDPLWQD